MAANSYKPCGKLSAPEKLAADRGFALYIQGKLNRYSVHVASKRFASQASVWCVDAVSEEAAVADVLEHVRGSEPYGIRIRVEKTDHAPGRYGWLRPVGLAGAHLEVPSL